MAYLVGVSSDSQVRFEPSGEHSHFAASPVTPTKEIAMHLKVKEGDGGNWWWFIMQGKRTLAMCSAPGFKTEAKAREAGERMLQNRSGLPKWVPWIVAGKAILLVLTIIDQFHTNLGVN